MKVLVVDDTKNIRVLLTKCLQIEGYEVSTAIDGREANDILMKESFDLIFLDIKLPYLSGTEVIKQIRERGVDTPVIVITAYATVKNAVECTQMGAVAYLQKPFTPDKVKSVLHDFLLSKERIGQSVDAALVNIEILIEKKSYSLALNLLKGILSKNIENPKIYLLLGKVYEGLENKEQADHFFETYKVFAGLKNDSHNQN